MISHGLFWHISEIDSVGNSSVVFGTIHLPIESNRLIEQVDHCIDQYDYVFTETSLDPSLQRYVMPYVNVDPEEWESRFSTRQINRLSRVLAKSYDIDFDMVKHLRPMFIMSMIYGNMTDHTSGLKLDQYIWQKANALGKTTDGIESIHHQVNILQAIPLEYEFRQFKKWTRNITKMNRQFKRLMNYYLDESILMLYNNSKASMTGVKELMLDQRNQLMAETIIEKHHENPGFFTFGAGHLAGSNGVLRLLKNKGFSIKPVQYD